MKVDDLKSQETFLLNLIKGLVKDLGKQHLVPCCETDRDVECLDRRTKAEGLSFLTKTLPKYGKALDFALLAEQYTPLECFKHDSGVAYPRLFRGFAILIFEQDGRLLEKPDVTAIQSLRQVSYLFYKYELPNTDLTEKLAVEDYVDVDQAIKPLSHDINEVATVYYAQEVINEIFTPFLEGPEGLWKRHLRPKNGPGAVAHGEMPWERYSAKRFFKRLHALVPYSDMFYYSEYHLHDRWSVFTDLVYPGRPGTAVLLAVPKDSRGPRLICKEPQEYMTYQKALQGPMCSHLEAHPLTAGHVNFTDQTINGKLALQASKDASLATIDLSAASDRLSCELVEALFEDLPELQEYLMASRTSSTKTPNGHIIFTRKFAPMGSALTFPVQSVVFFSLLVGGLIRGGMSLRDAASKVWVYGDDIIVPNCYAPEAISILESVGLKVNTEKSCFSGHFRESCGVDAYLGVDVTPCKCSTLWQSTKPEITTLQAWVSYSNTFFKSGYWEAADVIRRALKAAMGGENLPLVGPNSPLVGLETYSKAYAISEARRYMSRARGPKVKWSSEWQCRTYCGLSNLTRPIHRLTDGWERLLNYAWNGGNEYSRWAGVEPFSTNLFTDRHAVMKQRVVVGEAAL